MKHKAVTVRIARDCRGSVMVEVALFVPIIMFLLLGGVTLSHVVELSRVADRAAAVLAHDLAERETLSEADFDTAMTVATTLVESGGYSAAPWLSVIAVELHPENGVTNLWSRHRSAGGGDCTGAEPSYTAPVGGVSGAGIVHLLQVDFCATPGEGFFLLSALSLIDFSVHARAITPVQQAALRGFD